MTQRDNIVYVLFPALFGAEAIRLRRVYELMYRCFPCRCLILPMVGDFAMLPAAALNVVSVKCTLGFITLSSLLFCLLSVSSSLPYHAFLPVYASSDSMPRSCRVRG